MPLQGQLTSVTWQDGAVRRYHYEDSRFPSALTGITDEAGVRYATYAYDASGRISRTEHIGGTDRVDLSYAVSNGVPQTTVIDYAGAGGSATTRTYSFTDIGNTRYATTVTAPCPLCGTTQQASTYDASGNPTKQIAHSGTIALCAHDAKDKWGEMRSGCL